MIKAIIFDCWRTLFQQEQKPRPFTELATELGYNTKTDYDYLKCFERNFMLKINSSYEEPLKKFLSELGINVSDERFEKLLNILKKNPKGIIPYENTFKVLEKLKGQYKIAVLSNAEPIAFSSLMEKYKIRNYFEVILTSYSTGLLKPNPDFFKLILKKLDVNNNKVLMVGDSMKDDIIASGNCDIKGILLDRDNKFPNYKNRITSLKELFEFI